jgi:hypothetical protein
MDGGHDTLVTRVNRADFVRRFVQHALYDSASADIQAFLRGLRIFLHDQALGMCSAAEVKYSLTSLSQLVTMVLADDCVHACYILLPRSLSAAFILCARFSCSWSTCCAARRRWAICLCCVSTRSTAAATATSLQSSNGSG